MSSPFEYMSGLDKRAETYTIAVTMSNGASYGNLEVISHKGQWLQVRQETPDEMRPFWLRAVDISLLEVIIR